MSFKEVPTWTKTTTKLSVRINGLYFQFTEAPDAIQRFVRPAMFSTDEEMWELQYRGSATMVHYQGKTYAISTAHQTGDGGDAPKPEKFVVIIDNESGKAAVPPTSVHSITGTGNENIKDILVYEYEDGTVNTAEHLDLANVFWSDSNGVSVDYSFLIGYPSESVEIEIDSDDDTRIREYKMRWIRQDLEPATRQALDPEGRNFFNKHQESTRKSIEPDGLSGCPVFSIVHDKAKDRHLRFDGIVTHARGDRFAVYPSVLIRQVLDTIGNSKK